MIHVDAESFFGLVLLADKIGLDVLIGGFVAGMIVRLALKGHELRVFESKLTAVGFGFFVPFFFVRGTPALLLYRRVLGARDRAALAFYCATELPLVVAITTIAVEAGHMRSSTAAGLVGAAMMSTLIYPFVGLALRKGAPPELPVGVAPAPV